MPSRICLPSTNPTCSGEMSMGSKGRIIFDITWVIILYMTLHKSIGRNLLRSAAPVSFRMRVRKVESNAFRTPRVFLEAYTISKTSSFTHSQHAWKKFVVKPSGPRALSSTSSNSTISNGCSSNLFWASIIKVGIYCKTSCLASLRWFLVLQGDPRSIHSMYLLSHIEFPHCFHLHFLNG